MRRKVVTADCVNCNLCEIDDDSQFICHWGSQPKLMDSPKGKKVIKCTLKRK